MARLINQCRHGNTTMRVLGIVDLHVTFNSTMNRGMETQQRLPFVLLCSYKAFHIAVNNIIFFKFPYKLADIVACNLTKYGIYWNNFRRCPSMPNFKKICPVGAALIHADGQT